MQYFIESRYNHREFVGGNSPELWYAIGKRQFHFLISQGLKPTCKFMDIACGSFRLGQFLIPYLNEGNYVGIEAENNLIELGKKNEIFFDIIELKKPKFIINSNFNFLEVRSIDFAMAQSLFTHLDSRDIEKCFSQLAKIELRQKFFFSFFLLGNPNNPPRINLTENPSESHPLKNFYQELSFYEDIAKKYNFKFYYIGDWGHERNQKIAYVEQVT